MGLEMPKLSLLYTANVDAKLAMGLSDLVNHESSISRGIDAGKLPFHFTMEIPDPVPDSSAVNLAVQQLTQSAHSKPAEKRHVEGVLYYYPYVDGRETNPLAYGNSRDTAIELEASSSSSSSTSVASAGGGGGAPGKSESTFNVFWQDRLVPDGDRGMLRLGQRTGRDGRRGQRRHTNILAQSASKRRC